MVGTGTGPVTAAGGRDLKKSDRRTLAALSISAGRSATRSLLSFVGSFLRGEQF